jgi:hypothetical protein
VEQITLFIKSNPDIAAGIGLLLLVLIMLVVFWRYRSRGHDIRQFRRVIKPFALDMRTNLFVPDGVDGHVWVDYLILTQGGILLLDVRRYDGHLFGGENINEWTQLLGMKRSTFSNPLEKMPDRLQAVKAIVPDIPVVGRVIFTCLGDFPKGVPEGVSVCDTLIKDLQAFFSARIDNNRLQQAWQHLLEQTEPASEQH